MVVKPRRYRSGHQRYEAARNPTPLYESLRTRFRISAQAPAFEPLSQLPPEITQSMSSPHRTGVAARFFLQPAANHSAQLVNHAAENQVPTVAGGCCIALAATVGKQAHFVR